ncbi:hypothetical protein [Mangrovivirga cuniculi]|uniref:Uncharacterized protein n=1 Tax=Mangrovivirga cuniculi TaxID=2715131 RepID=A0A4D7K446_9BACT|nr:hypothetical protein [Mangrovivirga cuniculi]QCK15584.1 hypothetical protein DCC35_12915 [Mangrovivirga cuniculi]
MKNKVNLWLTLAGIIIGAISYWRIPYDELNLSESNLWLIVGTGTLIGSVFSTLLFDQKPWKIALLVTLGVILSIILRIIYDVTFWDPSSHNFAPFEVIFCIFQSLPTALIGAYLAMAIKKLRK